MNKVFKRGDVVLANLGDREGSTQNGVRPIIIIGNSKANEFSPVITVIPLTAANRKFTKRLPTHVEITKTNSDIEKDSIALAEQITSIDKRYIFGNRPLFTISDELMYKINIAVLIQLELLKDNIKITA